MTILRSFEDVDNWLCENDDFLDGYILKIEENPLSLTVGYTNFCSFEANTEHHIRAFKITPANVIEMSPLSYLTPSERFCCENIIALEVPHGVGIQIQSGRYFDLVADSFAVVEQEPIKRLLNHGLVIGQSLHDFPTKKYHPLPSGKIN